MSLVGDPDALAGIARAIEASPLVAFDLEFLSADRLNPVLCLLQVSWLPEHVTLDAPPEAIVATPPTVVLIDPLALDVAPIVRVLAAHPCTVVHAARQDLGILATRFGIPMPNIADTQVMAAFAGIGDQVGFATLANELLGTSLDKGSQWTDWARRPLSTAQLTYADADVRYLPAIYALLAARLGHRLAWARLESTEVAAAALAASQVTPETAWQEVGGLRGLEPIALSAVVALAAWRQRVALELDRPLGQVLNDKTLVDLARQRPDSAGAIRAVKALSPLARTRADDLLATLATVTLDGAPARIAASRAASQRAQRWSEILLSIVQLVAEQTGVAARLLATRSDAEELARIVDEQGIAAAAHLPAFTTWRRDVLGASWGGWLRGDLALVGDPDAPQGLKLLPL